MILKNMKLNVVDNRYSNTNLMLFNFDEGLTSVVRVHGYSLAL
jgi:hypothetical protein